MNIKKGDIVGRKSYGKDIYFIVNQILTTTRNHKFAILKGLNITEEDEISMCELFDQYTRRGISRGIIIMCKDFNATYDDTLQKLKNKLNISEKEAEEQMKLYW